MKKNIAMRVAAFLFILTMISTCAFATTFAKYTSGDHAEDTARVAKWGVTVTGVKGDANSMFSKTEGSGENLSVKSTVNVVAPGTKGDFSEFTIKGTPEVAVEVIYTAEVELSGWAIESGLYFPIVVTVNGTPVELGTGVAASEEAWEQAIEEAIARRNIFAAGTDLTKETDTTDLVISWSWAFNGDDAKDTELGDAGTATISVKVTCVVSQIDTYQ